LLSVLFVVLLISVFTLRSSLSPSGAAVAKEATHKGSLIAAVNLLSVLAVLVRFVVRARRKALAQVPPVLPAVRRERTFGSACGVSKKEALVLRTCRSSPASPLFFSGATGSLRDYPVHERSRSDGALGYAWHGAAPPLCALAA